MPVGSGQVGRLPCCPRRFDAGSIGESSRRKQVLERFEPGGVVLPAAVPRAPAPTASARRERDFGVGYGRSSGYAAPRGYVDQRATGFFRCR